LPTWTATSSRLLLNSTDGNINPARLQPKNAGLGAATGAQSMRNLQLQLRFQF